MFISIVFIDIRLIYDFKAQTEGYSDHGDNKSQNGDEVLICAIEK